VEPSPANFARLKKNIVLNTMAAVVELTHMAIGDADGTATLHLAELSNLNTLYTERHWTDKRESRLSGETVEVITQCLPTFLDGRRPIDFIRMDVEGFEVEILRGARRLFEKDEFRPMILFEPHRPKYDDEKHSIRAELQFLFSHGYHAAVITSTDEAKARFGERGYNPSAVVKSDYCLRGIYEGISCEDAETFICDIGFVRSVLLERKSTAE